MVMSGTQCLVERWSISAPFSQLSQHRSAALCGNVPLDTGMVSVLRRAWTFAHCACISGLYGNVVKTNGMG